MKNYLLAGALALVCLAPLAASASTQSFDLSGLVQATTDDLNAARADADARGDTIASQCYAGVEDYLVANPLALPTLPPIKGVASAFQAARDGVKDAQRVKAQFSAGIPRELVIACGPLALDVQSDLGKAVNDFTLLGIKLF